MKISKTIQKCFLLFALSVYLLPVFADSLITHERAVLHGAVIGIKLSRALNGEVAKNWEQILPFLEPKVYNRPLHGKSYRVDERYQFVSQYVSTLEVQGGRVLLVRVVPLEKTKNGKQFLYRYLAYMTPEGEISDMEASEERVQKMFKEAGVPLPKVEGLPAWESETSQQSTPASSPVAAAPPQLKVSEASPEPAPKSTTKAESAPDFPIWLVAILGAVIVAAVAFLVRRGRGDG